MTYLILYKTINSSPFKHRPPFCHKQNMSDLYKVERIIGKRIRDSKYIQYKVKWQGYPSSESTWEPIKHLKTVQNLIDEFEARNKDKLPPNNLKLEQKPSKFGVAFQKKQQSEKNPPKTPSSKLQQPRPQKKQIKETKPPQKQRISPRLQDNLKKGPPSQSQPIDVEQEANKITQTSNGVQKNDSILQGNLDSIAFKILCAVQEKKKQPKIIGIIKKLPENELIYQTEDPEGNKQYKTREEVMTHHLKELIQFYENQIDFKSYLS